MQVDITGRNFEITEALHQYVEEKMARIQRHLDQGLDAHVVLSLEKNRSFAEINLRIPGETLHADAESDDMYAAIDAMADRIDRQVRRYHGRVREKHRP